MSREEPVSARESKDLMLPEKLALLKLLGNKRILKGRLTKTTPGSSVSRLIAIRKSSWQHLLKTEGGALRLRLLSRTPCWRLTTKRSSGNSMGKSTRLRPIDPRILL